MELQIGLQNLREEPRTGGRKWGSPTGFAMNACGVLIALLQDGLDSHGMGICAIGGYVGIDRHEYRIRVGRMLDGHFSMIRRFGLADFFTLANGACGLIALFESMKFRIDGDVDHLLLAAALIPLAFVFDVLDGRIARLRGTASSLGRELDSLADVISFGVAPAAIAFAAGVDSPLDQIVLIFFALCGLSRLARFNVTAESLSTVTGKVRYFEGTPIPTSVVPLALLMVAFYNGNLFPVSVLGTELHLVALLFMVSGSLMISKTLRIPKL